MPDHVHAIAWLNIADGPDNLHPVGADSYPPTARQPADLKSLMRGFKGAVATAINTERNTPGRPIWQRGYFDRVIRSERGLDAARLYVRFNVEKCLMIREVHAPW